MNQIVQAAFIVDKYLSDNKFPSTRFCFRREATSLFASSPIHEAPKNLMTLNEMLEDYISLKAQKEAMDKEKIKFEHEKNQIHMLFKSVLNIMSTNNLSGHTPAPAAKSTLTHVPQPPIIGNKSHLGISTSGQNKLNTQLGPPSSISNISGRKRKDISDIDAPSAPKQQHTLSSGTRIPIQDSGLWQQFSNSYDNQMVVPSSSVNCLTKESHHVQGSNITMSSNPCYQEVVPPISYNAISGKRVMASPSTQMASKDTSHCISAPVMTNSNKPSKSDYEESMLGNKISTPASEDQFDNSYENQMAVQTSSENCITKESHRVQEISASIQFDNSASNQFDNSASNLFDWDDDDIFKLIDFSC